MLRNSRQRTPPLHQNKLVPRRILHQHIIRVVDIQPRPILRDSVPLHLAQRVPHQDPLPKHHHKNHKQQSPDDENPPHALLFSSWYSCSVLMPQSAVLSTCPATRPSTTVIAVNILWS